MGTRYILEMVCPRCAALDDFVGYAPTCGITTWRCKKCGHLVDLEQHTGITKEEASNKGILDSIIESYKYKGGSHEKDKKAD